jgi:F0F1-type ATP synthase assembly protein I
MVDDRSPTAKAMSVVSQITSIGVSAALPVIAGYALDNWLESKPVFVLVGIVLGFLTSGMQFMRLVRKLEKDAEEDRE